MLVRGASAISTDAESAVRLLVELPGVIHYQMAQMRV